MIAQYKSMTANPVNSPGIAKEGSLASSPAMLSFVSDIKKTLSSGALTVTKNSISMKSLGMDLQVDGTLKFNQSNLTASQSAGLLATLSGGISVGGSVDSSNNLYTLLSSLANPGGTIDSTVNIQSQNVDSTNRRVKSLSAQLATQEKGYYAQYSKLNSLLFSLNQTSSQLTSSLTAITNINKG
jgi:flagellar hook-associated protein 2